MPWAHGPCWINGAPTITATLQFPLLLLSFPVLTGTLLYREDQPSLPDEATERGLEKPSQVLRPLSKAAEDQLGTLALLAPGHHGPSPQGHRSQLGSRRELLHQGLKQGPRPVHFQLGEWRPRHGEWAGPHSPRKTLILE